jgi:hypothetical protein
MRSLLLTLIAILPAFGQGSILPIRPFTFPETLRAYLGLTESQAVRIAEQNALVDSWSQTRSQRIWQVQAERAEESAKDPLNPGALGVRYAEVEAIRREIAERNKKLIVENLAVLTPAQMLKFKALEEALKLIPRADEAKSVKLMEDTCAAGGYASLLLGGIGGVGGGFGYTPYPCGIPRIYDPVLFSQPGTREASAAPAPRQ